jgi:DNA topoisomerase III
LTCQSFDAKIRFFSVNHKIKKLSVEFNWLRNRLFDKACCEALLVICQADGQAKITNVLQKPKNKWRPQPMDTIELEKTGSRKLKLPAQTIMKIAEKLYTQGLISYPRTETNKFSKDMNLRPLVEIQAQHPEWGEFANRVLEWGPNPRNGNKSDQAHPPIHPTKFNATLQGNEKRVYELVCRHFLACVSRDAVGSETIVSATIANEEFTATGLIILERNYLDVYPYDKWTGKEIHHYEVGQVFTPTELGLHEGSTSPPELLTEADLIALMDRHGIGTDATHAEHIEKIKQREYINIIEGIYLVPGSLGMGLVEGYEMMNLQLAEPRLRAGLEVDLKAICEGRKNPQEVLAEQVQKYKECYQIITREAKELDKALGNRFNQLPLAAAQDINTNIPAAIQNLFKCPVCRNSHMHIKQKRDNGDFFISCQGFPTCKNSIWFDSSVKHIEALDEVCGNCGGENKKVKIKFLHVAMLGKVKEEPAFSRFEGTHYVTCLVCDAAVRDALMIPLQKVKPLGNVIGANSRAVQAANQPARQFGTNARGNNTQTQRGWNDAGDDDDDDDRPAGGGAVAMNTGRQNNNANKRASTSGLPTANKKQAIDLSRYPNVKCKCDALAVKYITSKEGANKGRPFHTCASRNCDFFLWADIPVPANIQQVTVTGGLRAVRKCGICKQTGHTRNKCPNGLNS